MWLRLRAGKLGVRFRRQEPIGQYIVDFVCKSSNLVVEVDGIQHGGGYDQGRDDWLRGQGYRVLRFLDSAVLKSTDDVVEAIVAALAEV